MINHTKCPPIVHDEPFYPSVLNQTDDGTLKYSKSLPNVEELSTKDFSIQNVMALPNIASMKQADLVNGFESANFALETKINEINVELQKDSE